MDTTPIPEESVPLSLSDYVVKYDMNKLVNEARQEFEMIVTSRELVSQDFISEMFNEDN